MSRVTFPDSLEAAAAAKGDLRAGGTDVHDLRRHHPDAGALVDLRDVPGLDTIDAGEEGIRVGARVRIADLAAHEQVRAWFPGLAAAAGGLATPAIRNVATVGGNLLQANRCWYHRHPEFKCYRSGGGSCFARRGDKLFHAVVDKGRCIAPHPSTLAIALACWDARVQIHGEAARRPVLALYGDGTDPSRDHLLEPGEVLTELWLAKPEEGEKSAWFRVSNRVRAEWPLVEAVVRLRLEGDAIRDARITLGGVANIPLPMPAVEKWLVGKIAGEDTWAEAGQQATTGIEPIEGTEYKVPLIAACIEHTLTLATA